MKTPIILAVVALAALSCHDSNAAPPPGAQRRAFLELYARTARCMRQGSVAAMRYGKHDRDDITRFTINTCGKPMYEWLKRDGLTNEEAAIELIDMSDKALGAALRGPEAIIIPE